MPTRHIRRQIHVHCTARHVSRKQWWRTRWSHQAFRWSLKRKFGLKKSRKVIQMAQQVTNPFSKSIFYMK